MPALPVHLDIYRVTPQGLEHEQRIELEAGTYTLGRSREVSIRLDNEQVSRVHAILDVSAAAVRIQDNGSTHGVRIGDTAVDGAEWDLREPLRLPGFEIRYAASAQAPLAVADRHIQADEPVPDAGPAPLDAAKFSRILGLPDPAAERRGLGFPADVLDAPVVSIHKLRASGYLQGECEYLAIGGGIGNFTWVDTLRVYGVPASAIRVIGVDQACYANYERYTKNSQIPRHARLRSNSISTPDNIWGFPGYASRETWSDLKKGRFGSLSYVWQVFGEPAVAESYTPKAGQVFVSLDREMARIGWRNMFLRGRVLAMRRTDDGRYAVAWRIPADAAGGNTRRDNIIVARFVQIATGYPATRFTQDLQNFRAQHVDDRHLVVNAYDPHDELYFEIERSDRPEVIVVRGRGIVASRVMERLYEARVRNPRINVVHQMRSRLPDNQGSKFRRARRPVFNDVEHQPFNWPKACWGGDLRKELERTPANERAEILAKLGGTSTADRQDWKDILIEGLEQGWYRKAFGDIRSMEPVGPRNDRKVRTAIQAREGHAETVMADYIVDCTGLIADVKESPFLRDLVGTYQLARNRTSGTGAEQRLTGITVSNDYEIEGLRNGDGRVYAAGAVTANGPYAPVDSFLGLAYSSLRSVEHLYEVGAPDISAFGPFTSARQWLKWCTNEAP